MSEKTKALRTLLAEPGVQIVPECYNMYTGLMVQAAGFPATYCGGFTISGVHYGMPDYGLMSTAEFIAVVRPIADRLTIPLLCDADHGGETPLNVYRTVRDFERAGVAGIHIEDSYNPKHAVEGKLRPVVEMCGRLQAAVDAKVDSNFVIIARTDVFYNHRRRPSSHDPLAETASIDEIIERGIAYAEAGADVFMPVELEPKHINRVADAVPIPVLDVNQQMKQVSESKLKVNVYTAYGIVAMAHSFDGILSKIRDHGEYPWSNEQKGVFPDGYGDLRDEVLYREIAVSRRS